MAWFSRPESTSVCPSDSSEVARFLYIVIMTEPDPKKRSLANTVTQCDLVKRASYLHEIISKFPDMTDREIMRDFSMIHLSQTHCSKLHLI
eukprot:jgi/Botrbrau1/19196/Bobra.0077s0099.1